MLARDHMANGEPSWRFLVPDAANEVPNMGELLGDIRSMDPQPGNYREVKTRLRIADKACAGPVADVSGDAGGAGARVRPACGACCTSSHLTNQGQ